MKKYDFYFRQKVTQAELDAAYAAVEAAIDRLYGDLGITGITYGATVSQHVPTPDLTVDVSAGVVIDQTGQRSLWSAIENVDCSVDENSVSTSVTTPGNEKWLSLFVEFVRAPTDERVDGEQQTVYFEQNESYQFNVVQGAEAVIPTATKPSLRSDQILLADIRLINAQTQILNADINIDRREWAVQVTSAGASVDIDKGTLGEALQDLADALSSHVTSGSSQHLASAVDYAGGGAWHDGTTNPATDVESQLDKVITDLVSNDGADRVGALAQSSGSQSVENGSIEDQIGEILSAIDAVYVSPRLIRAQNLTKVVDGVTAGHDPTGIAYSSTQRRHVIVSESGSAAQPYYSDDTPDSWTSATFGGSPTLCKDVIWDSKNAQFAAVGALAVGADIQTDADGSGTWTQRTATGMTTAGHSLRAICLDDSNSYLVAVGNGPSNQVVRSATGVTWSNPTVLPSVGSGGLWDVAANMDGSVVAVGDDGSAGIIFRSTDGGDNWTDVTPGTPPTNFRSVTWDAKTKYFYAVGAGGKVFRSMDFGQTWASVTPGGSSTDLKSVVSDGEGTIVASGGSAPPKMIVTTDTGTTWLDFAVGDSSGVTPNLTNTDTLYFAAGRFIQMEGGTTRDYWMGLRFGGDRDIS
jgi:photosystem II stability/assembly factor-like uncharacterized protein